MTLRMDKEASGGQGDARSRREGSLHPRGNPQEQLWSGEGMGTRAGDSYREVRDFSASVLGAKHTRWSPGHKKRWDGKIRARRYPPRPRGQVHLPPSCVKSHGLRQPSRCSRFRALSIQGCYPVAYPVAHLVPIRWPIWFPARLKGGP